MKTQLPDANALGLPWFWLQSSPDIYDSSKPDRAEQLSIALTLVFLTAIIKLSLDGMETDCGEVITLQPPAQHQHCLAMSSLLLLLLTHPQPSTLPSWSLYTPVVVHTNRRYGLKSFHQMRKRNFDWAAGCCLHFLNGSQGQRWLVVLYWWTGWQVRIWGWGIFTHYRGFLNYTLEFEEVTTSQHVHIFFSWPGEHPVFGQVTPPSHVPGLRGLLFPEERLCCELLDRGCRGAETLWSQADRLLLCCCWVTHVRYWRGWSCARLVWRSVGKTEGANGRASFL